MLPLTQTNDDTGFAIYVHWPFCKSKCPYCDFNSHVRDHIDDSAWQDAYLREIDHYADMLAGRQVQSVFFGGGTPSLMAPETAQKVIDHIDKRWGLLPDAEITLEANPTSVENDKLQGFRAAGVNRVSLGVQAMNDNDLRMLGRQHNAAEALEAVEMAARIFDRYTFDLIYARPDQTVKQWEAELKRALDYAADHMSLYQLTIEEGTAFHTLYQRGDLKIPDENTAADLYELTQQMMAQAGMPSYEISNHAREGQQSRHNLVYWRYHDYVGIGPGAHGRLTIDGEKRATRAHRAPEVWLQRVADKGHGAHPFETVTPEQRVQEMVMMGLRLAEGIPLSRFEKEGGKAFSDFINEEKIQRMMAEGFVSCTETHITATESGRQRLGSLITYLLT